MSTLDAAQRVRTRWRTRTHGAIGLTAVLGVVALALLQYGQVFTPVVIVDVEADRSGLLLEPRAKVTSRGVDVGDVREVSAVDGHARLRIAVASDDAELIPANAEARIDAPSVFGSKFVALDPPPQQPRGHLEDGDVLRTASISTETNTLFEHLMSVLVAVEPAKLNATLGAVSTALQGRGDDVGRYLAALHDYLGRFEPALPAVGRDLRSGAEVADVLARLSPDLLRTVDNGSALARTLQDKQAGLDALFLSFTRLGRDTRGLLREAGGPLDAATAVLRPTTALAARYSPTLPCVLAGTDQLRTDLERIVGGPEFPGIDIYATLLPPQAGYRRPADLPVVGARDAPNCRRNPLPPGSARIPYTPIDDGVTSVDVTRSRSTGLLGADDLATTLFGVPAGSAGGPR